MRQSTWQRAIVGLGVAAWFLIPTAMLVEPAGLLAAQRASAAPPATVARAPAADRRARADSAAEVAAADDTPAEAAPDATPAAGPASTSAADTADSPDVPVDADAPAASGAPADSAPIPATAAEPLNAKSGDTHPAARAPKRGTIRIEPVHFNGVRPGETSAAQLEAAWGTPSEVIQQPDRVLHVYRFEPFERVIVTLSDARVARVLLNLDGSYSAATLEEQLGFADVVPVTVTDDAAEPVGLAYPERGVLMRFVAGSSKRQVQQIILEPIDAEAFLLRAEASLSTQFSAALSDLETIAVLAPDEPRAHWLRARLLLEMGRDGEAAHEIAAALKLVPDDAQYRLTRVEVLESLGEYVEATTETRALLVDRRVPPEIAAEALLRLGHQYASGPGRDFKTALEYHQQAISRAQELLDDPQLEVRRQAQRILIEAHLAAANDVAFGPWRGKERSVPKWLERASVLAERAIDRGEGDTSLKLRVARRALSAHVGMQGQLDPTAWVEQASRLGQQGIDAATDPLYRQHLEWELGLALYDALQIYQMREQYDDALRLGLEAVGYVERGASQRHQPPGYAYVVGRLYFRIGSIYAIHLDDHQRAIPWFDKAVPLMEEPIPLSALADVGRQGETFVSAAISYWETGNRAESLRLTQQGLRLMERAVGEGILGDEALTVPYRNLAQMHRELGDEHLARDYEELAERIRATQRR